MLYEMKPCIAVSSLSGRSARTMHKRYKAVLFFQSCGSGEFSGCSS